MDTEKKVKIGKLREVKSRPRIGKLVEVKTTPRIGKLLPKELADKYRGLYGSTDQDRDTSPR